MSDPIGANASLGVIDALGDTTVLADDNLLGDHISRGETGPLL